MAGRFKTIGTALMASLALGAAPSSAAAEAHFGSAPERRS